MSERAKRPSKRPSRSPKSSTRRTKRPEAPEAPQAEKKKKTRRKRPTKPSVQLPIVAERVRTSPQRRLDTILRALPARELKGMIKRLSIRIDAKKRIDTPAQVARALVRQPEVRDPERLQPRSAELLRRIAELNGSLMLGELAPGVEELVRRGIVYALGAEIGFQLLLPTALLVQMRTWEGEDPRCLRALLSEASFETASAIASHYLGRPSTPPIALSMEPAWEVLGDAKELAREIEQISHQERRLLDEIERVGGEVDAQELMDLEREPMRLRGVHGVSAGRRGAAFSLEKRGFLFPLYPNRFVLPTEVAAVIGGARRQAREKQREAIRSYVVEEDFLPRRARFSADPTPRVLAMRMWMDNRIQDIKPNVGTPRSQVGRLAQQFGHTHESTAMLVALSRAVGLWEPQLTVATPPGSLFTNELGELLFDTWRRGGAWDEGRQEPEMLRLAVDQRDPSPVGVLREMVLGALQDLGEGQWVPYQKMLDYLKNDPRAGSLDRLFSRWAERVGEPDMGLEALSQRVLLQSLPALGVVDVGAESEAASDEGLALRLTARGRLLLAEDRAAERREPEDSEMPEPTLIRVGSSTRVAHAIALAPFVELTGYAASLELTVSSASISRGLSQGIEAERMHRRFRHVVELSSQLDEVLEQASAVVGRATMVPVGAFLWVEDVELRRLLSSTQPAADMFIDPSPQGGLLVAAGVDEERLVRNCRVLGVEVTVEEKVVRARSASGTATKRQSRPKERATRRRTRSWSSPATAAASGSRKRPSGSKGKATG